MIYFDFFQYSNVNYSENGLLKEVAKLLEHCETIQKEGVDLLSLFENGELDEEVKVGFLNK
jgi:hypothetical protein